MKTYKATLVTYVRGNRNREIITEIPLSSETYKDAWKTAKRIANSPKFSSLADSVSVRKITIA